jgi:LIM domain/Calponin homology (CH) domain
VGRDVQDGVRFIRLLEALSGQKCALKYHKRPRYRAHRLDNLSTFLRHADELGCTVKGITAADVHDLTRHLILNDVFWALAQRFVVDELVRFLRTKKEQNDRDDESGGNDDDDDDDNDSQEQDSDDDDSGDDLSPASKRRRRRRRKKKQSMKRTPSQRAMAVKKTLFMWCRDSLPSFDEIAGPNVRSVTAMFRNPSLLIEVLSAHAAGGSRAFSIEHRAKECGANADVGEREAVLNELLEYMLHAWHVPMLFGADDVFERERDERVLVLYLCLCISAVEGLPLRTAGGSVKKMRLKRGGSGISGKPRDSSGESGGGGGGGGAGLRQLFKGGSRLVRTNSAMASPHRRNHDSDGQSAAAQLLDRTPSVKFAPVADERQQPAESLRRVVSMSSDGPSISPSRSGRRGHRAVDSSSSSAAAAAAAKRRRRSPSPGRASRKRRSPSPPPSAAAGIGASSLAMVADSPLANMSLALSPRDFLTDKRKEENSARERLNGAARNAKRRVSNTERRARSGNDDDDSAAQRAMAAMVDDALAQSTGNAFVEMCQLLDIVPVLASIDSVSTSSDGPDRRFLRSHSFGAVMDRRRDQIQSESGERGDQDASSAAAASSLTTAAAATTPNDATRAAASLSSDSLMARLKRSVSSSHMRRLESFQRTPMIRPTEDFGSYSAAREAAAKLVFDALEAPGTGSGGDDAPALPRFDRQALREAAGQLALMLGTYGITKKRMRWRAFARQLVLIVHAIATPEADERCAAAARKVIDAGSQLMCAPGYAEFSGASGDLSSALVQLTDTLDDGHEDSEASPSTADSMAAVSGGGDDASVDADDTIVRSIDAWNAKIGAVLESTNLLDMLACAADVADFDGDSFRSVLDKVIASTVDALACVTSMPFKKRMLVVAKRLSAGAALLIASLAPSGDNARQQQPLSLAMLAEFRVGPLADFLALVDGAAKDVRYAAAEARAQPRETADPLERQSVSSLLASFATPTIVCNVCDKPVQVGQLTEALGNYYHQDCFRCNVCRQQLETFFAVDGVLFCDVHKSEADGGAGAEFICASCNEPIEGVFLRALGKYWHSEHFACHKCNQKLDDDGFFELADRSAALCDRCAANHS